MKKIFLVFPLLLPSLVFFLCALTNGFSFSEAAQATMSQFFADRQSLFFATLLNLFPVLLLLLFLWILQKWRASEESFSTIAWGGFLPIAVILIWVNVEVWPLFLPGTAYPGFPHGLEMIIGPAIFAPLAATGGVLVVVFTSRRGREKNVSQ